LKNLRIIIHINGTTEQAWQHKMKKGRFFVFEGIDGSGEDTQLDILYKKIKEEDKYQDVITTHEPWKNKEIKRRLEEDTASSIYYDGLDMAELYVGDRIPHTKKVIRPGIEIGAFVLSSRYKMSTCAFQWAQGVQLDKLLNMHENVGLIIPEITFFLDVPREIAQERIKQNRERLEKYEKDPRFIDKLIQCYYSLIALSEADSRIFGKVVKINGDRSREEISEEIFNYVLPFLEK